MSCIGVAGDLFSFPFPAAKQDQDEAERRKSKDALTSLWPGVSWRPVVGTSEESTRSALDEEIERHETGCVRVEATLCMGRAA